MAKWNLNFLAKTSVSATVRNPSTIGHIYELSIKVIFKKT
jgi:hypothetical protein